MNFSSMKKNRFVFAGLLLAAAALVFLILSFVLPLLTSVSYYQKTPGQLRSQKKTIQDEFNALLTELQQKKSLAASFPFSEEKDEVFRLLKRLNLDTEREGVAFYTREGKLTLWLGNVVDFLNSPLTAENTSSISHRSSFIINDEKASVYLAAVEKTESGGLMVFYRLLAFIPRFKTTYLKDYHFLKPKLLNYSAIQYWDFRDDVSGFERLFSRHHDEYFGQPGPRNESRTLLFPLRNEEKKIVATVTLSAPSLPAKTTVQRDNLLLFFYILLSIALLSLLLYFLQSPSFFTAPKFFPVLIGIVILIGLRLILFPLSQLEKVRSLSIFSPSPASFFSLGEFTKSPADIFLTALFLFLIAACLTLYSRPLFKMPKKRLVWPLSLVVDIACVIAAVFFLFIFQEFLFRLVTNSNVNLLRFTPRLPFLLLHLSLLFFFGVCIFLVFISLRIASLFSSHFLHLLISLLLVFTGYYFLFRETGLAFLFVLQALVLVTTLVLAFFLKFLKRKEVLFSAFLVFVLFIHACLHCSIASRNRSLIQNSVQNIIRYQEIWADFLLNQSMAEMDKREDSIVSFLQKAVFPDFAHSIWERTSAARFNWYSSLEVLDPETKLLSRFSLNIPELYSLDFDLPLSRSWSKIFVSISIMGQEKEILLGYRDWFKDDTHLGRTVLSLSVDYDMLPFLYSANPYFELLRVSSIPSLNSLDLGFAIFDIEGKLLFNPNNISSGIPPALLEDISSRESFWSSFRDKRKEFASFYFRKNSRIYSLFVPEKNFYNYLTDLLRIFFLYLMFLLLILSLGYLASGKKVRNPFWSFSNRVYISFVLIALIPLLFFSFFTRSFFTRIFSQHFTEKAEIHASFAQRIVEDFMLIQQEEMVSLTVPPENVILTISSIISNDVNLYQDGMLISSSRREFFDYGLLPELIDGETYYRIQYENNPFSTQTQRIGGYSFHTLTTSYQLGDSLLLISLPFPLEQEEIFRATEELIEFLFFISVFFIGAVLVFARGIGHTIVTPIKKLLIGTREVSVGNLDISIPHKSQDEMRTLVEGFNTMIKSLKKHQQELADMSKKVAWTEMARKVAHEIKNPLTPIQLSAEHLLRVHKDKRKGFARTLEESASYIINEVQNLRKIAQDFLDISKEASLEKELFSIRELVEETMLPYKKMLSDRIRFKETYRGEDFYFYGDRSKLRIALRNIFINAVEAIEGKGEIEVRVSDAETEVRLEVMDSGIGMEKKILDKIFEPNFSTKEVGTGLGLPISRKIIEDHGGSILVSSRKNQGTRISIVLPRKEIGPVFSSP